MAERPQSPARDVVCAIAADAATRQSLIGRAWDARFCRDVKTALEAAKRLRLDVFVVDVDGLGLDPRRFIQRVRSQRATRGVPIVFVAGPSRAPSDLLETGADDCLLKPIEPELLAARVEAALKTARQFSTPEPWARDVLRSGDGRVILNVKAFRCQVQMGLEYQDCRLTRKQLQVLALLLRRQNHVVRWRDFMSRGWRPSRLRGASRTLVQHVMRLRQVLGPLGERIETVSGVGYRWRE